MMLVRNAWVFFLAAAAVACEPPPPPRAPFEFGESTPREVWEERFDAQPPWVSPSEASAVSIEQVFAIERDGGGPYLSAKHVANGDASPPAIHWGMTWKDDPIPLDQACSLSWRWRVRQHPAVTGDPWEDVAASVYVVMSLPGVLTSGKGFKFGWLSKPGPRGTKQRGLVQVALRHGPASDTWKTEQVNLCRLYAKHFGDPRDETLLYVGVVTDADNTASVARGDYDDFLLSSAPPPVADVAPNSPRNTQPR